jgi:hypothetical protein
MNTKTCEVRIALDLLNVISLMSEMVWHSYLTIL